MSHCVAREIATSGTGILVATLLVVGGATGVVLHTRQVHALDEALLAAAHGRAHPTVPGRVEVEHSRSPYATWLVWPGDSLVPDEVVRQAQHAERPTFVTVHEQRVVLLPFEVEDHSPGHSRGLAAAAAPRVTLARSAGALHRGGGARAAHTRHGDARRVGRRAAQRTEVVCDADRRCELRHRRRGRPDRRQLARRHRHLLDP